MVSISSKTGITRQEPFTWEGVANTFVDMNHGLNERPAFWFVQQANGSDWFVPNGGPYIDFNDTQVKDVNLSALGSVTVRIIAASNLGQFIEAASATRRGVLSLGDDLTWTGTHTFNGDVILNGGDPVIFANGIKGVTDGSSATTGQVGEVLTNIATVQASSSNVAYNVISWTLPAGSWVVHGVAFFAKGTATANSYFIADLSLTSATLNGSAHPQLSTSGIATAGVTPLPLYVNTIGSTVVYAIAQYDFSSVGDSSATFTVKAQRIR